MDRVLTDVMRHNLRIALWIVASLGMVGGSSVRADFLSTGSKSLAPEVSEWVKGIEDLDKAVESFKRREYDKSLDLLRAAAKKHAHLPPARLMLARLFLASNQRSPGREALEQAAGDAPEYPGIYLAFADLAASEGRLTDALVHLEKSAVLANSWKGGESQKRFFLTRGQAGMASVAEERKDWEGARKALAGWLTLEGANGKARQRLARALFELDKPDEAARELERAVKDDASLPPVAVTLGWLYTRKGDLKKAAEWMERAVKDAPKDPKAHLGMASWLLQHGNAEQAKVHADVAARLGSDSRELKLLRGRIAWHLKDYLQAESYFHSLHQESPGDFSASNQLALALVEQPDKSKRARALQLAEINARVYPNSVKALSTLGWVYYRLGRLEDAERIFQAAAPDNKVNPEIAYYLAHLLADRGQLDTAKQLLKSALDVKGNFTFKKEAQELLDQFNRKR